MTPEEYLASIHMALMGSPIIQTYVIIRQRISSQSGHLRVRIQLNNGDFLEAAEYFSLIEDHIQVIDYRHQWMGDDQVTLIKRWDSTPHHPEIESFPHHIHLGAEDNVIPGTCMSIQAVLDEIASHFQNPGE
jgi:hypothetical protein